MSASQPLPDSSRRRAIPTRDLGAVVAFAQRMGDRRLVVLLEEALRGGRVRGGSAGYAAYRTLVLRFGLVEGTVEGGR